MSVRKNRHIGWLLLCLGILPVSASLFAAPVINSIQGVVSDGEVVTINGSGFSQKPNAAPLFWWRADFGSTPSNLGRKTAWDRPYFNGSISTAKVAPGSKQSIAWDHGVSTGAALSAVGFNSDRIYLHRKLYEDFDVTVNFAIRTRVTITSGSVAVGDTIKGQTSGATGRVTQVTGPDSQGRLSVFYDHTNGSINANPRVDFVFGEVMTGPSGSFRNAEGSTTYPTGTYRTFNYKILRFWNLAQQTDSFVYAQGINSSFYNIEIGATDGDLKGRYFDNPLHQLPYKWQIQELVYKASDVDVRNGLWNFYLDGVLASNKTWMTRDSAHPAPYDILYQTQVSNGAQLGSNVYYDSLYVDDTFHHVVLCSSASWSNCTSKEIQIPTSWNDNQIVIQVNAGGLDLSKPAYFYVVDKDGNVNDKGYPLCMKCPLPPTPS